MKMTALYHWEKGRQFRPTRNELNTGKFTCPYCPEKVVLRKKLYKIQEGQRGHLLHCPQCSWSIRRDDIWQPEQGEVPALQPPEHELEEQVPATTAPPADRVLPTQIGVRMTDLLTG